MKKRCIRFEQRSRHYPLLYERQSAYITLAYATRFGKASVFHDTMLYTGRTPAIPYATLTRRNGKLVVIPGEGFTFNRASVFGMLFALLMRIDYAVEVECGDGAA